MKALFPITPVPCGTVVTRHPEDPDRQRLQSLFSGIRWDRLTLKHVIANYDGPIEELVLYSNATGLAYYLPALIQMCIDSPEQTGSMAESILQMFARNSEKTDKLLALLTQEQKAYVSAFLCKQFQGHDYWDRFLVKAEARLQANPTR